MTEEAPLTPQQAYNKARGLEQAKHRYSSEGIHVVCSCSYVGTTETIREHVEGYAEAAGVAARDKEVARRAHEYDIAEAARKKREAADQAARLARAEAEIKKQDAGRS